MVTELEPDYTYKMQCKEHYNKLFQIVVMAQKYVHRIDSESNVLFFSMINSKIFQLLILFFRFRQKQYTDLFALAAEDDTSGVGRRGTSGRGRKPPPAKKETNSTNSSNKKNSEPVYNSSDESSEVNEFHYCYY